MPVVKPLSALRNRANELSRLCHDSDEPIFITKRGTADLVLMSLAAYDRLHAELARYRARRSARARTSQRSGA
jgi:prevent-host-death family protein